MKDSKLNRPLFFNKKYHVYLNSDNKFSFTSKRSALEFLAKINRSIDEAILLITEELNTIEPIYNLLFLADDDYKFKFQVKNSLDYIKNRLEWFIQHSGSQNYDTILFTSIVKCFEELIIVYGLVAQKAFERRDTITKRRCALKIDLINLFLAQYMNVRIKDNIQVLKIKKAQ